MEAGLVLTIAPWTLFWERNYFAQVWPWLSVVMDSAYTRGAVTGVGVVTAVIGVRELSRTILARGGAGTTEPNSDR